MKKLIKILVVCIWGLYSCENELEIPMPHFEVLDYDISEVFDEEGNLRKRVTFRLDGTADVISFYSGELGSDFEFRGGRVLELQGLYLSFEAVLQQVAGGQGAETFSVLASTDFNGGDQPEDAEAATWRDITDRFTFEPMTSETYVDAGLADITDLTEEGKPIYLALRHNTRDQTEHGRYSLVRVRGWQVTSLTNEFGLTTVVNDHVVAGFYPIEIGAFRAGRNVIPRAADLTFRGNHGDAPHNEVETTVYAISAPISAGDVDMGPDRPVAIKSREDLAMETYSFDYSGPGEYEAVFFVSNVNAAGNKSFYRHVKVVVPE